MKNIHIGTSGWHYEHWEGPFYPKELPKDKFLKHYEKHFHTVEVNDTFYKLPQNETLIAWRETVQKNFIFSVKASRYITHVEKLKDPRKNAEPFLNKIGLLGGNLGPILFQLPPRWEYDTERLDTFLKQLSKDFKYVFEFRDHSWFNPKIEKILIKHGAAFCIYDIDGQFSPKLVTANFIYIRLYGPDKPHKGKYSFEFLSQLADDILKWARQGKEIYCYFDNDERGYAPQNALEFQRTITHLYQVYSI